MPAHVAFAAMLIRRPIAEVFAAFTDPAITSRFWFSDGSAVLREPDQRAHWRWSWYGFESPVGVLEIRPPTLLKLRWGEGDDAGIVSWRFTPRGDDAAFVEIEHAGFQGDADAVIRQLRDSTEGFAFVLAGAKAWLEQGVQLNLVPDRHPDAHVEVG